MPNNTNSNKKNATRPVLNRMDTIVSTEGENYHVLPLPSPETEHVDFPAIPGYRPCIPYMAAYSSPSRMMVGIGSNFLAKTPITVKVVSAEKSVSYRNAFNPYVYKLEVEHGPFQWTIYKRYKHFLELNEKLWAYRATLHIPLPSRKHIRRRKTHKDQEKESENESKIPHFPKRPDVWVSEELIVKRQEQLEKYINIMLKSALYRNHAATKKFLEVSKYSFIEDLGRKGKEGVIRKRSGGHRIRLAFLERALNVRTRNWFTVWTSRWFVVKDTYIMYLDPRHNNVKGVLLFDKMLTVETTKKKDRLMITNNSRKLMLNCWTERQSKIWKEEIEKTANFVCPEIVDKAQRHKSFAPMRYEKSHWFVDGRTYMDSVAEAIDNAQEEIFITDWWLSPEIYLKRPLVHGEYWRLDKVLKRKADEGVKIYVLLYKEVEMAITLDSAYSKRMLQELNSKNIRVLRHPDHMAADVLLWAHHEKIVVIDQIIAYVGGIDLCYGRWDDHSHRLTDLGAQSTEEVDKAVGNKPSATAQPKSAMESALGLMQVFPMAVVEHVANQEEIEITVTDCSNNDAQTDSPKDEISESTGKAHVENNDSETELLDPKSVEKTKGKTSDNKLFSAAYTKMSEAVEKQVKSKYWVGKDYNNCVLKDLNQLDEPYDDNLNRKVDPRMPWHDVACVTYGKAARDAARHFIQRWNFTKIQKAKKGEDVSFLLPKSYDIETIKLDRTRFHPDAVNAKVQILRSSSEWSAGITETEYSIQNAYISAINASKHFIYIENQFFISVRNHSTIRNRIVEALYQRIMQAVAHKKNFRVFVVMPLIPGMMGDISDNSKSQAIQAVLHWQFRSIIRGEGSLIGDLEKQIGGRWTEYVSFCGLRTHSELGGKPITEIVYVHSKMMVADDRVAIIGSANINDRSMTGVRDSEVAMIVEDIEMIPSTMDGQPFEVGKYASRLRKRSFGEHLGAFPDDYDEQSAFESTVPMDDVVCDEFFKGVWMTTAGRNSTIYEKVFCCVPCDYVKDFSHIEEYEKKKMTDVKKMREELTKVKGNLVLLPLQFLSSENLVPDVTSKEGMVPTELWT